jgi:hypothetical protein
MRALRMADVGGGSFEFDEVPRSAAGDGEVLIGVALTGINSADAVGPQRNVNRSPASRGAQRRWLGARSAKRGSTRGRGSSLRHRWVRAVVNGPCGLHLPCLRGVGDQVALTQVVSRLTA